MSPVTADKCKNEFDQDQMLGTVVHRQQASVKNITEKNTSGISE